MLIIKLVILTNLTMNKTNRGLIPKQKRSTGKTLEKHEFQELTKRVRNYYFFFGKTN
jgi:hypothetical protein